MPNLNIGVIVDFRQAESELKRFQKMLLGPFESLEKMKKSLGTGLFDAYGREIKQTTDTVKTYQKDLATYMRKQNDDINKEELKNLQQKEQSYRRIWGSVKKDYNAFVSQMKQANKTITQTGGFDWLTGEKARKDAKQSAAAFKEFYQTHEKGSKIIDAIKHSWFNVAGAIYTVQTALRLLNRFFQATFGAGIRAVEDYQQNVITASAVTLQVMDPKKYKDIGEAWKAAKEYAAGMVPVLEEVAVETMLTGQHVNMLFTQFAKHGVLLDATNEKAVAGFKAMANAIAIMTKGQGVERQIMSEINALMEGQARQGAVIYDMLEKMIPNFKEQLKVWKEEGTVFENLLPYLKGFDAASKEIKYTWEGTKTTLQTTVDRILREGMKNVYVDIIQLAHQLNNWLKLHREELKETIKVFSEGLLEAIKLTAKLSWKISQAIKPAIESLTARGRALSELETIERQIEWLKNKLSQGPNLIEKLLGVDKDWEKELARLEKRALEIKKEWLSHTGSTETLGQIIKPPDIFKIPGTDEKALKKAYADIAQTLANQREVYKDSITYLEKMYDAEITAVKARNAEKEELERHDTAMLQKDIDDQKWLLETFYDEDIMDAEGYYKEKEDILNISLQNQLSLIKSGMERQLDEYLAEYRKAEGIWQQSADIQDEIFGQMSALLPENLQKYLISEDWGKLFEKIPENLEPIIKNLSDQYRNLDTQMQALYTTQLVVIDKMGNVTVIAFNKATEAVRENTSEIMKNTYQQQIASALQPLIHQQYQNEKQKEYNELMMEANEIIGNWDEVERLRIEIMKAEAVEKQIAIDKQIIENEENIKYLQTLKELTPKQKERLEALKASIPILQKLSDALKDVNKGTIESQTFTGGIQAGINEFMKELQWNYERAKKETKETADTIKNTLIKMFDDPKAAIDDLGQYFLDKLKMIAVEALAQPIIVPISLLITELSDELSTGSTNLVSSILDSLGLTGSGGSLGITGLTSLGIGSLFGGGTGIGATLGGLLGGVVLTGAGTTGMGLIGAELTSVLFSALGIESGALLGSIVPIIGTLIGAGIGALIGSLFGDEEPHETQLAYYPEGIAGTTPEYAAIYGDVEWGVRHYDILGEEVTNNIINIFDYLKESLMSFTESIGGDISKFYEYWESSRVDITEDMDLADVINAWAEAYAEFVTGIDFSQYQQEGEELADTIVRIIYTISEGIPDFIENIDDYIAAINNSYDAIAQWQSAMSDAEENLEDIRYALEQATDPSDALEYAEQIRDGIYEIYTASVEMVEGLVDAIKEAELGMTAFEISMQQKIDELLGTSGSVALIQTAMADALARMQEAGTPEDQLEYLELYLSYLDQLSQAVENQYQSQIDTINDVIDGLNEQKDIIADQIDALETQLDLVEQWQDVLDSTKDMITDLALSSANPADVYERLGIAREEIERVMGLYTGAAGEERAGYASELLTLISDYLGLAQEAYQRPSSEYQSIYDETLGWLEMIQQDAETQAVNAEDLLQQIADLESQSAEIDEQIAVYEEQIVAIEEQMEAELSAFRQEAAQYYQWAQTEGIALYQEQITELQGYLGEIIGDHTPEEYIAQLQQETILQLTEIRDILQVWYNNFMADIQAQQQAAGLVTPGGGAGGGTSIGYSEAQMQDLLTWYQTYWGGIEYSLDSLIADFNANTQAWLDWLASVGYSFPSYQHGGIVERTGLALVHAGERVYSPSENSGDVYVYFQPSIYPPADASPREIAKEMEKVLVRSLDSGKGREVVIKIKKRKWG